MKKFLYSIKKHGLGTITERICEVHSSKTKLGNVFWIPETTWKYCSAKYYIGNEINPCVIEVEYDMPKHVLYVPIGKPKKISRTLENVY